jgi:hypothetical protein
MKEIPIYLTIGVAITASIAGIFLLNLYLIIASLALSVSMFFLYKLWDVFEALIIKKTGVVQILGDYELEGDRVAAVSKMGGSFKAVSVAVLKELPSREISKDGLEKIIASSNAPFRLVMQVEKLNTEKISDDLKTRRRLKEIELSKVNPKKGTDHGKIIEREIELIESEINSINSGSTPLRTNTYIMSVAASESRFVAQERALSQVKTIAGEFSAVLGANFEVMGGADLISVLRSEMWAEVHA